MSLYFSHKNISLHHANALDPKALEKESLDCTITSPPYNVGIAYNANEDGQSYLEYLDFSTAWLQNAYLWAKDSGRLCLNIPLDKNKGGQQSVGADLVTLAKKVGWLYHSTIIWN
ncbi:hypothetical protein NHP190003_08330 [Helicobacter sp. NHP19-003]|uniref:site-specific DNA-methyltransferase (cytosine-N(4)-specific) n=1 Tax=Helicobacter gastrocanis TaxID=2849641 RepID=A0ABM7SCM1_9HELI|nr:hypothetical protein NHP190003_08330 [Helicobacter sp. NHP19-003]